MLSTLPERLTLYFHKINIILGCAEKKVLLLKQNDNTNNSNKKANEKVISENTSHQNLRGIIKCKSESRIAVSVAERG